MDLLGDIIERDTADADDVNDTVKCNENGFPEPFKPKQISSWKQRLRAKKGQGGGNRSGGANALPLEAASDAAGSKPAASAAQSIHEENVQALGQMSPEAIEREKRELMESLDPKLVQRLIRNMEERASSQNQGPLFAEVEGAPGTWVGGGRGNWDSPNLDDEQVDKALGVDSKEKRVDDIKDLVEDDVAPLDFQAAQSVDHMNNQELFEDVHFLKPEEPKDEKLAIDDPEFDEKLHDKFFPDLPRDVEKLKWMQPLPDTEPADTVIEDVSQCRFDFNGNLVPPTREIKNTTHSALHHHSDDPQLAGYTIPELQRLSRSTFPSQRSIAIQTLGRILYKLGKQAYYQLVPEVDADTYKQEGSAQGVIDKIYSMFWDLCKDCRIMDCLQDGVDEKQTRNLSVRNYALEALWLWKKGGGDFRENV